MEKRDILSRLTTIKNRLRRKLREDGMPENELDAISEDDVHDDDNDHQPPGDWKGT